ncbi:MAG: DUF5686 family protein, partial [Ferruginibacter sp.]
TYILLCQHIGYASMEKTIILTSDTLVHFRLNERKLILKEVVVTSGGEDPAYAIIRQAIKKREYYNRQVDGFSCDIYGKDVVKLRKLPRSIMGKKIKETDKREMGVDSAGKGIIYLSESVSRVHKREPADFKMEVVSSRVSGSGGFSFTFPAFISLYQNNVTVFTDKFNPRGFVSPISDGALGFYKFKFLGSFFEDGKEINSIRVTPKRKYEPLFSGIINISENDWRIHSFDMMLTKTAQLEIIDTLQISQLHVPVSENIWRTKNQLLHFNFKFLGIDMTGNFLSVYSNYLVNPLFDKKFFDRVIIKYDTAVNKRSYAYWDSIRAVPLENEETLDYRVKDSIYKRNKDSVATSMHIDSLNKRQGDLKLLPVIWKGVQRTHFSKTHPFTWGISSLLLNTAYNTAEGIAVNMNGYIQKPLKGKNADLAFEPLLRYGFSNKHFNPSGKLRLTSVNRAPDKKFKQFQWIISGGKRVSEFNRESEMETLKNTVRILVNGHNFMKTYENYFGMLSYLKKFESGFRIKISATYEDRLPLNNITNFTLRKKDSLNITPNYPYLAIPSQFQRHQAGVITFNINFKPGQRYIQLPNTLIPIGSKYPTFSLHYEKGIPAIGGSDVDYDRLQLSVSDEKNLKLAGTISYNIGAGGFLNNKSVFIQDYKHFNRNSGKLNSFELADFYAHSTISSFYSFAHIEHHFNGLITNKIPLFKKLNWNLLAGSNILFINRSNNYSEVFIGLENIFKVIRIDAIAAYEPGFPVKTGIRLSAGGVFGNVSGKTSPRGNSMELKL